MANILTRSPIYIDTAFASWKAGVASALGTLITLRVRQIRWVTPSTVGHQLDIRDPQSGNQLLLMTCPTAGQDVVADWSAKPVLWTDFGVEMINSGKAYIYADIG
jgi:hypothetical protein